MISVVAAVALAQGGYYAKLFPTPSGSNGYEEFVLAADIIESADSEIVWSVESLDLKASRELVARYGSALTLIERGITKPLTAPWDVADPELPHIGVIIQLISASELLENKIKVQLADGKPASASSSYMTALRFSDRSSPADLMESLSGTLEREFHLKRFAQAVHQLPLADVIEIRNNLQRLAQITPKLVSAWRLQLPVTIREIEKYLSRERNPEESEFPTHIVEMNVEQRAAFRDTVAAAIVEYQSQLDAMFGREERSWHDIKYSNPDPLVEYVVSNLYPFPSAEMALIDRTRLRLAAHYCSVIEFKRVRNRLPESLVEIGPTEKFFDPASGEQFVYRKNTEQSFFIYSKGNEWTGPIHLGSSPWGEKQ
jgi:hypothetical protein